jgi:hypothetical protein
MKTRQPLWLTSAGPLGLGLGSSRGGGFTGRILSLVLAMLAALTGCSPAGSRFEAPRRGTGPGLVILLVIDQFPQWAFEQKLPELRAGGFRRLLSEGSWRVGHYPSAVTLTAPGHALLGSGEASAQSGILSNEWWHRDLGRSLKSVEAESGAASAKWLRVPGLGDAVAAANNGAKAVSVSIKDRAAILPLGHAGTAIWYTAKTVDWKSTVSPTPAWLTAWSRSNPIALRLHDPWEPLDAGELRRMTGRHDYQVGEYGDKGLIATFPHNIDQTREPADALVATPLGNEIVLTTALAAIDGEHLGFDDTPDLLIVSLSSYDYIAHAWGQESWEVWDTALRLDRQLATFLDGLDREVGAGRWAMIMTSDHGGAPLPELVNGGRMQFEQLQSLANQAAISVLGPGSWIAEAKSPTLYLSEAARQRAPAEISATIDAIIEALRHAPGLARVERTASLVGNCEARTGDDQAICLALDPERSGEVVYVPKRGWLFEEAKEPVSASHGTLYEYDRRVPVIQLPFGRKAHAPATAAEAGPELPMRDVSSMIAGWLGITPPLKLPRGR